jgi:dipeptidyl aminopeptidase/acylaminoacyl peptidase
MRTRTLALATALAIPGVATLYGQTPAAKPATGSGYLLPPKVIVDILDAAPTPTVVVSPDHKTMALLERRNMPTIAELAQPIYRLAGQRINPRTNGPQQRGGSGLAVTLRSVADGSERKVVVPASPNIGGLSFSPDSKHLSFTQTRTDGIDLYVADTATGQSKLVASGLNGTGGDPCDWMEDSVTLLCQFVPAGRGPAPPAPLVPTGPNIQETSGKAAPAATFEDLLKTEHDEALFDYYFTSQLSTVDSRSGQKTAIGKPGIIDAANLSPNNEYILVTRIKRPFSRLVPMNGFPKDVEIWTRRGEVARKIADVPGSEGVPINGVLTGPRGYRWRPEQPATLIWAEALDGGDIKNKVPFRDKVMSVTAPFKDAPTEIIKTEFRFAGLNYTEKGIGLLGEADRATRRTRTWILAAGAEPKKLWERRQQDRYGDPGSPVIRRGGAGGGFGGGGGGGFGGGGGVARAVMQVGDSIYLTGQGASPEGDRPFLDRLDLKTLQTERLWRCEPNSFESVVMPLSDDGKTLLTRFETTTEPPNYYVRDLAAGTRKAVTAFKDPQPQLRGVQRQFVTYERKDGVKLSGTLYLPPGYQKGQRLPVVMWAYPREFTDRDDASQVTGSPNRFTTVRGPSHLLLLTQGYAIFDDPTMPIVGDGETANDHYVEQLVASAEAAVNKVVEMGVGDRDRIGVGGHSYGAFMTANLLAHTDLFRAGIARSGAYNRTLTPFGFQSERRTFWEIPDVYAKMSPFHNASKINEPILLTHGEADDNSGTFPIQSERLYMALKGLGATVRYVTLPYEAHGYAARETNLHVLAEMVNWMDKYVKNAAPRTTTSTADAVNRQ